MQGPLGYQRVSFTGESMKKLALVFAFCAVAAFGAEWTGYISETHCGAKHNDGSQAAVDCVKGCIKGGAKPVLVVDDKVVSIANPDKVPESLYGLKVTVKGKLKGDAVEIASIAAAK
jgi:hypothetical protein